MVGYIGYESDYSAINIEKGLTPTAYFAQSGQIDDLLFARNLDVTFACEITFPASFSSDGTLFKLGGSAIGGGVGLWDSGQTLRIIAGDGANPPDLSMTALLDIPTSNFIPGSSGTLVWDYQINPGRVRAWWNGSFLGEAFTSGGGALEGSVWAGTNDAAYVLIRVAAGPSNLSQSAWPGTAQSPLRYYSNQLVDANNTSGGIYELSSVYRELSDDIVKDGLVLHLDAGDIKSYPGSGTTWFDISGNNINGTLINGVGYSADSLGYLTFDGVDDTVNFDYDFRSTWSYECWGFHNAINGFAFLGQGTTSANNGLHIWFISNTALRFGMYSNDTDALSLATSTNVWYHYCFTYNHSTFAKQIYRNGVQLTGTPVQAQSAYTGTGTARIGATYSSGGGYANGRISNAKLYNRVLSAQEIQQNFNALRGRYGI
jgi:hypothetical protein